MQKITLDTKLHSDGNWVVTSQQVPGLVLGGDELLGLLKDLPNAVQELNVLNKIGLDMTQPIQATIEFTFFTTQANA